MSIFTKVNPKATQEEIDRFWKDVDEASDVEMIPVPPGYEPFVAEYYPDRYRFESGAGI